jgi:hypothetical protein
MAESKGLLLLLLLASGSVGTERTLVRGVVAEGEAGVEGRGPGDDEDDVVCPRGLLAMRVGDGGETDKGGVMDEVELELIAEMDTPTSSAGAVPAPDWESEGVTGIVCLL